MNFTDITVVLDRSGSMGSIHEATVKGINDFIAKVKETPGEGCWSLFQFDDRDSAKGAGEPFPQPVFVARPDREVPLLEKNQYVPRGGTALVDAICLVVGQIKARLAALDGEERKHRKVMLVVMTDGQENASAEFTTGRLRELMAEAAAAGWEFMYLGANQDEFAVAASLGVQRSYNYAGLAPGSVSALPFANTSGMVAASLASGAIGVGAWKAAQQ